MKKIVLGIVGALAVVPMLAPAAALAAPANPIAAQSYADLLKPIPDTVGAPKASDATLRAEDGAKVELAQYFYHRHHHHFFHRPFYRHHHHHFFHRRFFHRRFFHHRHFYY